MKKLILLSLILSIHSCKNEKEDIIKADLAFKLINFTSFYGGDKNQIEQAEKVFDSILEDPNSNKQDRQLAKFFVKLKEHGLHSSPSVSIKTDKDSLMMVYLSESEYKKIKDFKHLDLLRRNKKIELELQIQKKDSGIYYVGEIMNVNEVDGKTMVIK